MRQTSTGRRRSILLLCDRRPFHANTTLDHIDAFGRFSRHRIHALNPVGVRGGDLLDFNEFDAVVIHYSIVVTHDSYMTPEFRRRLSAYAGPKIAFLQDEYRSVDETTARMRELRVSMLFTVTPPAVAEQLYGARLPGVQIVQTLTGYMPDGLASRRTPPLEARPLDVGYRSRPVPFWLGRFGQEKVDIARKFLGHADASGLRCDIRWNESDRIYGEAWNRFVESSRATLGTGSGASIVDFDGSLERRVHQYLDEHPGAEFEEVHAALLAPFEGNLVIDVVSPRVFEAAALRTVMVLFPGHYSGVIEPWTHYIPLRRDFSNIAQVIDHLRDTSFLRELTERSYADLVASKRYSYERFVDEFDQRVSEIAPARGRRIPRRYYLTRLEARLFGWRLKLRLRARLASLLKRAPPAVEGPSRR
jgi:hypothetical protein